MSKKRNDKLEEYCKRIPLHTRFKVCNEMMFITLLSELGYREDKYWTDEENELLTKICTCADRYATELVAETEQFMSDYLEQNLPRHTK